MYKEIIKKNWKSGSEDIMNKSVDMVAELLEEMKEVCPKKYWWFIRKQQGLMSGGHYDGYSEEDFIALLDCLSAVKGKFVLSSYPSEVLDRYVEKYVWRQERIEMARSAGFCEGVKVEVLTWNFEDSCGKQGELFE